MTRYSTPKRVKSDREFLFEAVQEVCNVFVITSVNTSSYKVQSIRKKKEARDVIKHFKVQAELQTGTRLLRLMTDRWTEFWKNADAESRSRIFQEAGILDFLATSPAGCLRLRKGTYKIWDSIWFFEAVWLSTLHPRSFILRVLVAVSTCSLTLRIYHILFRSLYLLSDNSRIYATTLRSREEWDHWTIEEDSLY